MWIFGYGSLMWDGWEGCFAFTQRVVAELRGYKRTVNKGSVKNWGTQGCPCPTLNLESDADASCVGIAFEFPEARRTEVEAYLAKREGKNFVLAPFQILVERARPVQASVPLYTGNNILPSRTTQELVSMVQLAHGANGRCSDYVTGVYEQLTKLGISDPIVTCLWELLRTNPTG